MASTSQLLIYSLDRSEDVATFIAAHKRYDSSKLIKESMQVILHSKGFSRIGRMDLEKCLESAELLKSLGIECFFQWDILMVESTFLATSEIFKKIDFTHFSGVRVQDPGALHFLKEESFTKAVHFITDQGNHNTIGLQRWLDFWPNGIKRLVISPEIPADAILLLQESLDVEIEVLGAGSILLFYTPRHLVTPLYGEEKSDIDHCLVWGTSEESPHKGFPIVENQHGTFMFNTKEVLIFDEVERFTRLRNTGKVLFRIDYCLEPLSLEGFANFFGSLNETLNQTGVTPGQLKSLWKEFAEENRSLATTKGFFRTNKTDVLFKKLKSTRLQTEQDDLIGEVVDVKKKKYIGIRLNSCDRPISLGEEIELTSPEGNIRRTSLTSMKNADGIELEQASKDQVIFIPHVGGISVKTTVCRLKLT